MIESINNEKIKRYAKLNLKKYRDLEGLFIVEGEHLVEEAKGVGILVDVFSLDGSIGTKVSEAVMRKLSSLNSLPKVLGIAKKLNDIKVSGNILVLDGIQDPGNLGTIIRSAVAFDIDTIVASKDTVDVYNSKTLRSSEGMFFNINYIVADLENILSDLDDYDIFTTNVSSGKSVSDVKSSKNYVLIMGNEGNGVREEISNFATDTIYIPMNKKCESLNVAIATSIILYELSK
ncbi:MAG: RNA methyltransferase [Bacilli bacterium]|nr:RNA methyltransferase [Bacilli bacterium]